VRSKTSIVFLNAVLRDSKDAVKDLPRWFGFFLPALVHQRGQEDVPTNRHSEWRVDLEAVRHGWIHAPLVDLPAEGVSQGQGGALVRQARPIQPGSTWVIARSTWVTYGRR